MMHDFTDLPFLPPSNWPPLVNVPVPLMGSIGVGTTLASVQTVIDTIWVPSTLIFRDGEDISAKSTFALIVSGDSMVNAGLFNGDTALLRKTDRAHSGDIVLALVDEEELALRRFRQKGASVALEAADFAYATRVFGPDRVRIRGKLVAALRKY